MAVPALACAAILVRWASEADPIAIAFWRVTIAAAVWTPAFLVTGKKKTSGISARQWKMMLIAGGFLCFHFATWTSSLFYTNVSSAVFMILIQPILIAIAAHYFLKERLNYWNVAAIITTLIGASLICGGDLELGPTYLFGDLLAFLGAIGSTGYLFIARLARPEREGKGSGIPIYRYLAPVYWTASVGLFVICLVKGIPLTPFSSQTWASLLALGLVSTVIGHSLLNWSLGYFPAFAVNIFIVGEPLGASLLAYLFLSEIPSAGLLAGAPLMILSVILVVFRPPGSGLESQDV